MDAIKSSDIDSTETCGSWDRFLRVNTSKLREIETSGVKKEQIESVLYSSTTIVKDSSGKLLNSKAISAITFKF